MASSGLAGLAGLSFLSPSCRHSGRACRLLPLLLPLLLAASLALRTASKNMQLPQLVQNVTARFFLQFLHFDISLNRALCPTRWSSRQTHFVRIGPAHQKEQIKRAPQMALCKKQGAAKCYSSKVGPAGRQSRESARTMTPGLVGLSLKHTLKMDAILYHTVAVRLALLARLVLVTLIAGGGVHRLVVVRLFVHTFSVCSPPFVCL